MAQLNIKPRQTAAVLLKELPPRARDVLIGRFGLGKESRKETLERIGKRYGVTRERVRQIENFGLASIKRTDAFERERAAFEQLRAFISQLGGVVAEEDLLEAVASDKATQNHIYFLLNVENTFKRFKEDKEFRHRWMIDRALGDTVHAALRSLGKRFSENDLITEKDMLAAFSRELGDVPSSYNSDEVLRRWLRLSKVVGSNQLGDWGLARSPNIKIRGVRDYAYLVIRRHGSPLHFEEVAKAIKETFGCKSHPATCHNELIKDKNRFVLVGRGLYGLSEWGYVDGVVRDVIINILQKHGPLPKDELVNRVLQERHVKENTVVVNLQNKKCFARDSRGRYTLA